MNFPTSRTVLSLRFLGLNSRRSILKTSNLSYPQLVGIEPDQLVSLAASTRVHL